MDNAEALRVTLRGYLMLQVWEGRPMAFQDELSEAIGPAPLVGYPDLAEALASVARSHDDWPPLDERRTIAEWNEWARNG